MTDQTTNDCDKFDHSNNNGALNKQAENKYNGAPTCDKKVLQNTIALSLSQTADAFKARHQAQLQFDEFLQNTSFHGLRFIFDQRSTRSRKVLWALCVLTAILTFGYQVGNRIRVYSQFQSNINVEVEYNNEVSFPSVTLCNQNNFRISKAAELSMFTFLESVYGIDDLTTNDSMVDNLNLTAEEFTLAIGHSIEDFIESCLWQGHPCDMEEMFETRITNFGVCYTFNSDGNYHSIQSGSNYGLALQLNTEQYEYMSGPHTESGIKILLHNPHDVPLMEELGFVLSPGIHALVSLQKDEVISLPQPYGLCVEEVPPRSVCLSRCRADGIRQLCGCIEAHMPEEGQTCDIKTSMTCIRSIEAKSEIARMQCNCSLPCNRTSYTPDVSTTRLSKVIVNQQWKGNTERRKQVAKKFVEAKETRHRVDREQIAKDETALDNLHSGASRVVQTISTLRNILSDEKTRIEIIGSPYLPPDLEQVLNSELRLYTLSLSLLSREYLNPKPNMKIKDFFQRFGQAFGDMRTTVRPVNHRRGPAITFLQHCVDQLNNITSAYAYQNLDYYSCEIAGNTYIGRIRSQITQSHVTFPSLLDLLDEAVVNLPYVRENYTAYLEHLYGKLVVFHDFVDNHSYRECMKNIENVTYVWTPKAKEMKDYILAYLNSTDVTEMLNISLSMENIFNDSLTTFYHLDASDPDTLGICNWFNKLGKDENTGYMKQDPYWARGMQYFSHAITGLVNTRHIHGISEIGTELLHNMSAQFMTVTDPLERYVSGSIGRLELHQKMIGSDDYQANVDDLDSRISGYLQQLHDHLTKVAAVEENLYEAFLAFRQLTMPLFTPRFLQDSPLLAFMDQSYSADSSLVRPYLTLLDTAPAPFDPTVVLLGVVEDTVTYYRKTMENIIADCTAELAKVTTAVTTMQEELRDYLEATTIKNDFVLENYLRLDIYFKELSVTRVTQQKAFEILSLLSEIGGFLGLLLGASVLTVCELMDFLFLKASANFYTDKKKN